MRLRFILAVPFLFGPATSAMAADGLLGKLFGGANNKAPAVDDAAKQSLPEGTSQDWSSGEAGAEHLPSGTKCPIMVTGFTVMRLTAPQAPNILGACLYSTDDNSRQGGIRVRRYVRGVGESPLAIQNDRGLMEPNRGVEIPVATFRVTPLDGGKSRLTITIVRKGFLIDCFADGGRDDIEDVRAKTNALCGN